MKKNKLIEYISERLAISASQLSNESGLGLTPGWDSIAHLEIMVFLEKEYGVLIDEHSMVVCSRIESMLTYLGLDLTE